MKYTMSSTILLGAFAFVFALPLDQVPNLQSPQFQVYTAGQPTDEGFRQLAAMGIKTVINVLPEQDCLPGEGNMVSVNGMKYYQLPFDPAGVNMQTIQDFQHLLNTVEKPVLIHCSTGNHVGGLWFAYRVLLDHEHLLVALKEAREIGMKPPMEKGVFEWMVRQFKGPIS